jgi:hypothetical protein
MSRHRVKLMNGVEIGLDCHNCNLSPIVTTHWHQLQEMIDRLFPTKRPAERREYRIIDWEMVDTDEEWTSLPFLYTVNGLSPMVRQINAKERAKGRSSGYWQLGAQEQWDEDKRLGLLDWDGE